MPEIRGSSNIAAADYDEEQKTLRVRFGRGHEYSFHDVSPEEHRAFVGSGSKGQHLKAHLGKKRQTRH